MDHKELLKRRFEFYTEIKQKVESYLGKTSRQLEAYVATYSAEVRTFKPQRATQEMFFRSLAKIDVLLFGDFHSEPQSMRSLLRVCRKLKTEEIVIGLECVQYKHQGVLDRFISGDISEADFLQKIEWAAHWDFPFDFVRPLFHWASLNQIRIYALNDSSSSLKTRDLKIAKNIESIKKQFPDYLLIVQIGDYHLARKHLPASLKKVNPKLKIQTVFQSPDEVYFKWMRNKKTVSDFLKIGPDRWAVMAVLPWVKWQNYLLWLESSTSIAESSEDSDVDMTDHIARFVQFIGDAMKWTADVSELSVYDLSALDLKSEFKGLDRTMKTKIRNDISEQKSFFVPELKKAYLQNYSLNHICKLAAEYFLYKNNVYKKTISDPQKQFISLIWLEMLTYFFTKIVNPKRKTNTVFDMRTFLMTENFSDHGKDVLSIALQQKLKEMNSLGALQISPKTKRESSSRDSKSYAAAARLLGGIMGEKVFWAYTNKRFKLPQGKSFLFHDIYAKSFQLKDYDLIEVIEQWPTTTKSKYDQF